VSLCTRPPLHSEGREYRPSSEVETGTEPLHRPPRVGIQVEFLSSHRHILSSRSAGLSHGTGLLQDRIQWLLLTEGFSQSL